MAYSPAHTRGRRWSSAEDGSKLTDNEIVKQKHNMNFTNLNEYYHFLLFIPFSHPLDPYNVFQQLFFVQCDPWRSLVNVIHFEEV